MTRGHRTSERKAAYDATLIAFVLACYGIYKGVDLSALAVLISVVVGSLVAYGGFRTALKRKQGEEDGLSKNEEE